MLVLYLLGLGVHLLFSLSLATFEVNQGLDVGLLSDASLIEGSLVFKSGLAENQTVDRVVNVLLDGLSTKTEKTYGLDHLKAGAEKNSGGYVS